MNDAGATPGSDGEALRELEAVLFAAATPLTAAELARHLGEPGDVAALLDTLAASYAPRGINLVCRGGRWLFQTAPDLAHVLATERAQRASCRAPPSRRWRSSPITSR